MFTGAFKDFQPEVEQMQVQSFWTYTMETFILVPKNKANEIKNWKDRKTLKARRSLLDWLQPESLALKGGDDVERFIGSAFFSMYRENENHIPEPQLRAQS